MCTFSLLTVCLNPGEKLRGTLESALGQTFGDFELIIKDGGSTDGSLQAAEELLKDPRVRLVSKKDAGIYDAMNQAVEEAKGEYVFFLNCGDRLFDETVLEKVAGKIEAVKHPSGDERDNAREEATQGNAEKREDAQQRLIIYGNVQWKEKQSLIVPPAKITGFTCYRNVPCHQACFYDARLCKEKPFETKYKIRGDYEHFLWCHYRGGAKECYLEITVAEYEGGGYSESKANQKRSKREHREITKNYMGKGELLKYRMIMAVTLQPLRTRISENPKLSGAYYKLLGKIYKR